MTSCSQIIYFNSGDWSCASCAAAIWYCVFSSQHAPNNFCEHFFLSGEHSSNYFQLLAFSHLPFTSCEPVHSAVQVMACVSLCVCVCVLFNNSHLPVRSLESFILQSAGEFIEHFGIQAIRKRNTNIDLSKRIFFSPAMALLGSGALSQK